MLTTRDHDVDDYVGLRDMDATDVGVLADDDRACLGELGEYLVSTDAWRRFAIWLLHKHFEPSPGEVFVERVLDEARQTRTGPARRASFTAGGLHPTALRVDTTARGDIDAVAMEFAEPADHGSIAPLCADDEDTLSGIAERLRARGKTDRFGVRLIRDPLSLAGGEVLLETCDSKARTLFCDVTQRRLLPTGQTVETMWRWSPGPGATGPLAIQECYAACVQAPEGHDYGHATD